MTDETKTSTTTTTAPTPVSTPPPVTVTVVPATTSWSLWTWIKLIFWAIVGIAAAIVGIDLASKRKSTPVPVSPKEADIDAKTAADTAKLAEIDQQRKDAETKITETAVDTAKEVAKSQTTPEQPGGSADIAEDIKKNW